MRIASLEIAGFGPFAEPRSLVFASDAPSVVLGPNESGKSHVVAAIFGVLFGLSPEQAEQSRSWSGGSRFDGAVVFAVESTRIRITRDFITHHAEILDVTEDGPPTPRYSGDGKSPEYFLELGKLVGFQDAEIASSTTFISHRDMETRVSDKLRQMISGCKQADYEKILDDLRRQQERQSGLQERREKELQRLHSARAEVEEVLGEARRLQRNIENLQDEVRQMGERITEDTRTLDGLQLLNLLLREEAQTQERLEHVQEVMETVDTLSRELAEATSNRQKFPEFEAYGNAFPDDLHALADARKELARVQKEMEKERQSSQRLQSEIRKQQEELTASYGAFEDLPDDFPERLQLFATRQRDLTSLSAELKGIGSQVASLEEEITRTYPRFTRFGDDHADRLHALEAQEKDTKKELRELEHEHSTVVDTQSRLKKQSQTLLERFAAFDSVAEDFPSRLRSYRSLQAEFEAKRSQVDSLTVDIEGMEVELGRDFKRMHDVGPDYGDRIDAARVVVERADRELPRLARERENVQRLLAELEEINGTLKGRLATLENRTDSNTPERLREYRRLKEEYVGKRKVIDEAQARIQEAQREVNAHFGRFRSYSDDWGEQLEAYRKDAERTEVALDQLRKEEQQYHELRRELDRLEEEAGPDAELLEAASDDFPEVLREFARLRTEVNARVQQIQELKDTIKQLEESALHDYSDYFGVGDDYANRLTAYRTEREHANQVADGLKQGSEEATSLHTRLMAVEKSLHENWPQLQGVPVGAEEKVRRLIELGRRSGPLSAEVEETRQRHQELKDQVSKQASGLAGLIGRQNQAKVREVTQLAEQLATLQAEYDKVDGEIQELRKGLGKLAERSDLTAVLRDLEAYEKAAKERQDLQAELDATQALVKKARAASVELEGKLQREMEQLDVNSESDLDTLISRFKEYQGHMGRLNSARRVLKSHQLQSRGEDGELLTDLERSQLRVAELEKLLGGFVSRLPEGDADEVVNELVEAFRNHRRRRQEISRVDQRLAKLPNEEAFAVAREEHNERLTQARDALGIQAGEPVEKLLQQWREYEKLVGRIEVEQRVVRSHEEEFVETGAGKKVPRLDWLKRRLNKLEKELGEFARSDDFEALIEQVTEQRNLLDRRDQVLQILENLPPPGEIDRDEAAHLEERRHAIESLGMPSEETPDFTWLEDQFERYLQLLDRCEGKRATLRALLEERTEDGATTTTLDRMQSLLGELRKGLGSFYNAQNVDEVLKDYNAYAALKEEIAITKRNLAGMQNEDALLARIEELELQRMNARDELGLLPEEDIGQVLVLYREYVRLVSRKRTQEEVRDKLLATVSLPPDFETPRTADKVLAHLQQQLDDLRTHLGGFEEAGDEATDDVIGQFREAQRLRRDIDGRKAQLKKLRSEEEMEMAIEEARAPMGAAEAKLSSFGDLSDLELLRGRWQEWSTIVTFMATTQRALEEHPTLDTLGEQMETIDGELDDCKERITKLVEERAGLAKYRRRTPAQVDEARPVLEHQISRARENQDAISHELEKVQTTLRTLVQPAATARGNLEVLDEQVRRIERERDHLGRQQDAIRLAIEILEGIVKQTQETLVPSLQIRASDILNQLTGGKYPNLELEGTHLSPLVKSKSGTRLTARQLSGGLRDQVYFALRAAMAWEMSGKARLPFILDDPFVQFDAERLDMARRYLASVQERHQVILLTRDERCRTWGEVVLDLSTPAVAPSVEAPEVDIVTAG